MVMSENAKPTAMIVDDTQSFRMLVTTMLTSIGFNVVAKAANGDEALELYQQTWPHFVLLDIHMPGGLDGVQTLQKLIAIDPNAVVVMLTSMGSDLTYDDCINIGAKGYIKKDQEVPDLQHEIHVVSYNLLSGQQS